MKLGNEDNKGSTPGEAQDDTDHKARDKAAHAESVNPWKEVTMLKYRLVFLLLAIAAIAAGMSDGGTI